MGVERIDPHESDAKPQKRQRSTVKFPYSDLGAAIKLAETIKSKAGLSCETTQLATWMGHSVTGGTFRSRYSAARLFGLIRPERTGVVTLTGLGQDVLNPQKADRAKVKAFLNIELFRKIYEKQKGHPLPPPPALQRMVGDFGVSPKQQERARQTFTKSATVAQFVDPQTGAFIEPGFPQGDDPEPFDTNGPDTKSDKRDGVVGDDGGLPSKLDPIIVGLIRRLPDSGNVWPIEERTLWLDVLANSFKIVYKETD